ncbi:MAG: PQQ-like beta-propeller repeat protein, partial [Chloroflexi bacterium]|nr:PQQ-like beta-propeller repeat protein [Chloroflexota bacterium]
VADGSVYVSTFEGHIWALSASTGEVLPWSYESEVGFVSSPLVADGMVYVGTFDRFLYAIALGADQPRWQFEGENWFWGTPVVVGNVIYAPCLDGKLYALDAASGKPVWDEAFDAGAAIAASPAVVGDSLVVATKAGEVYFVNAATGNGTRVPNADEAKQATCGAMVVASPCYHQGMVYVRAQNNVLYGIDPVSKKVGFTFSLKME